MAKDQRILTQLGVRIAFPPIPNRQSQSKIQNASIVMIQCVGPGEKFCSRLCCSTALKNALKIKELNPSAEVTILYRDIRTYGFKERLYTAARRAGVRFIRFDFDHKPEVEISEERSEIAVHVHEPILNREVELHPDLWCSARRSCRRGCAHYPPA
jgi:heterodisulfide reductase subunit A-like polyferredoxin